MDKFPTEIHEWLVSHQGSLLKITKTEDNNEDKVQLTLQSVDYVRHKDYDDYLSPRALLLLGKGEVLTDFGEKRLPYDFFEIPLTDHWEADAAGNTMRLQTDRGIYTIETGSGDNP